VNNVTVLTIFKFDHLTQALTLDEFAVSLASVGLSATGLGDLLAGGTALSTELGNRFKDPILFIFNTVFKGLVNVALQAVRAGLMAG